MPYSCIWIYGNNIGCETVSILIMNTKRSFHRLQSSKYKIRYNLTENKVQHMSPSYRLPATGLSKMCWTYDLESKIGSDLRGHMRPLAVFGALACSDCYWIFIQKKCNNFRYTEITIIEIDTGNNGWKWMLITKKISIDRWNKNHMKKYILKCYLFYNKSRSGDPTAQYRG